MKTVSAAEVYTTKISSSFFTEHLADLYRQFSGPFQMFTENNFCNKSRKSLT